MFSKLSQFPNISQGVTSKLGYKKFCGQWVAEILMEINQMDTALYFLSQYHMEGEEFLNRIVIDEETWIVHVNAETKQQLMA
ncbi:hypothetical protein X975_23302, partial [Stegodyphus mimosarum]